MNESAGPGVWSRLWARLVDPMSLTVLIVAPAFWGASRLGVIADVSIWIVLGVLGVSWVASSLVSVLWPGERDGWRLWASIFLQMGGTAVVMYSIGWGPTLAIGIVFSAIDMIRQTGARAVTPAIVSNFAWLGLGELAIALGLAPTLVPEPLVHGLALFAALGVMFTIQLYGRAYGETQAAKREVELREEYFRALVQNASDIILVIGGDGTMRYVSPSFESVLGYAADDVVGRLGTDFAHDEDVTVLRASLQSGAVPGRDRRAEVRMRHHDGSWRWFEVTVTNLADDPNVNGWVANLRDVSERKAADLALAEAQEAFRHAFDDAPIGMALASLDGHFLRVNQACAQLLGRSQESLVGMTTTELTHPDDRISSRAAMEELVRGEQDAYRLEKRYLRRDGSVVWVALSVSMVCDADGHPLYQIGQMEDISDRKALRDRLEYEATHDPLTSLSNRAGLMDRVAVALDDAREHGSTVAMLFVDLDHFKLINDGLGHAAGDDVLATVALRLRRAMRPDDIVGRFGGDEFVVLCKDVSGERAAAEVAQRIANVIAEPIMIGGDEVFVTASIGVALCRDDDTADSLLHHADAGMYRAKSEGRARVEVFHPDSTPSAVAVIKTGSDLHRALERRELDLHYQPVVNLRTGKVAGFEALLRWHHPERGLLPPGEFIGLAEETGLIVPIGAWVLETACRQTVQWQNARKQTHPKSRPLAINVNLSPRQVADRGLSAHVTRVVQSTGIAPGSLCLEITEGSLMHDTESVSDVLNTLHSLRVQLSIDDFGTGYSSLSYLKRFPVAALKIDRSFVDGLGREPEDTSIVTAIVQLAHALGLAVVAEGLETPEQLEALRGIGCDYAQGYLLGRPTPASVLGLHPADDLTVWNREEHVDIVPPVV